MSLDREVLAERVSAVERHLARVAERLPDDLGSFRPSTDASDAVILHLWQATQIVLDVALGACATFRLGTPAGYADAFVRIGSAGILDEQLARRLAGAAGFRNVVAHAYETLDMERVHRAASSGPSDLREFLARIRDRLS